MSSTIQTSMSLFHIEQQLADLLSVREEMAAAGEDTAVCDTEIAEYVRKEVVKVDSVRGYLRHCQVIATEARAEAKRLLDWADSWENRAAYLKGIAQDAMTILGKRRLDGKHGYLLLKGNGGKQAVDITEPSLVPEDLCQYQGCVSGEAWEEMKMHFRDGQAWAHWEGRQDVQMERIPHKGRIGKALESGPVAGARLMPRGEHIEVK